MMLTEDIAKQNIIDCFDYREISTPINAQFVTIQYMDTDFDYEQIKLEHIRLKRDIKIDICLGEKDEDNISNILNDDKFEEFSIKIFTKLINKSSLSKYIDVYRDAISVIESSSNYIGSDIQITNDSGANIRRIISKCMMCASQIAVINRVGPGNIIIAGINSHEYFKMIETAQPILPLKIIYDYNIQPDKVIVGRRPNVNGENGLHILHNNGDFYIGHTGDLSKKFTHFLIK
jgi:hypothetical protein